MTTLASRQYYRKRVNGSMCRMKKPKSCRKIKSCRMTRTTANKTHYCRKRKNTRRKH